MDLPSYLLGKSSSGGGGTSDYDSLSNKPQINGVTLSGNKSSGDLGIGVIKDFDSTSEPFNFSTAEPGVYFNSRDGQYVSYKTDGFNTRRTYEERARYIVIEKKISDVAAGETFGYAYGFNSGNTADNGKEFVANLYKQNSGEVIIGVVGSVVYFHNSYVTNSGNQIVYGVKTFDSIPKQNSTTAPTQDKEFANKKYVDDSIAAAITTTLGGSY